MTYITREDVLSTLVDMKSFYQELKHVFQHARMNIEDNLGRRNILMSQVQEEFLARALSRRYENVIADGSPGKADIFIAMRRSSRRAVWITFISLLHLTSKALRYFTSRV